jgi:hypothetical protein
MKHGSRMCRLPDQNESNPMRFTKPAKFLPVVLCVLGLCNFGTAQTWVQTSAPSNVWQAVALSADGSKLVALASVFPQSSSIGPSLAPIFTSTNGGNTWVSNSAFSTYWTSAASSADGLTVFAGGSAFYGGRVFFSTNFGNVWTNTTLQSFTSGNYGVYLASSSDGKRLLAAASPDVLSSTNSGITWVTNNVPNSIWASVASSADGTKLAALGLPGLWTSTNSGGTWTSNTPPTQATEISGVACSADGAKLFALGKSFWASTDMGKTWTSNSLPVQASYNPSPLVCSADGTRIAAAPKIANVYPNSVGWIYTSTDSGLTWSSNAVPGRAWTSLAMSADGCKLVATAYGDGIWMSQTMPAPHLDIMPGNHNIFVSWILPSANFNLQKSGNLSGWSDVPNPPVLNQSSLCNQVALTTSNNSEFYRLNAVQIP